MWSLESFLSVAGEGRRPATNVRCTPGAFRGDTGAPDGAGLARIGLTGADRSYFQGVLLTDGPRDTALA